MQHDEALDSWIKLRSNSNQGLLGGMFPRAFQGRRKCYLLSQVNRKAIRMNKSIISAMDIPPPPPPLTAPKRFSKAMIAVIIVIVLVVAGSTGAYYAMTLPHDNNPGPEPSPTTLP